MAKRTVLVTGASSGIGCELAKIFAREGYDLVLVARSEAQLNSMAADFQKAHGSKVTVIPKDLGQLNAPVELFQETEKQQIVVDVLVNSAGFATYGNFTDIETETDLNMIQVNVMALTHLIKLYLPGMKARRFGQILNIGSTASFYSGPLMAVYYATKGFVLQLSEALNEELKGTGVTVTALCPGPTKTGFQKRAEMQESKILQSGVMDVQPVAEEGYKGLIAGKSLVVPGLYNKGAMFFARILPRQMATRMVLNNQQRVGH